MKLVMFLLTACAGISLAQMAPQPMQEITHDGEQCLMDWEGVSGRTYFIQYSLDLQTWSFMPVIESGAGTPLGYGFDTDAEKMFLRLYYTDTPTTSPNSDDFDGDGISNWDEVREGGTGTNPMLEDTNGDGIRDDGLVYAAQNDPDGAGLSTSIQNGLIGRWDFEILDFTPQTGFTFADKTGNGNHATPTSGAAAETVDAVISKSCKIPNTGYLSIPATIMNGIKEFNLSLWIKPTEGSLSGINSAKNRVIWSYGDTQTSLPLLFLSIQNQTSVKLRRYNGSITEDVAIWTVSDKLDDGQWRHLSLSRATGGSTGTLYKLYVNGEQISGEWGGGNTSFSNNPNGYFLLGRLAANNITTQFDGLLDRLLLHNRGLTQVEALSLYRNDIDGDGLWDISEHKSLVWRDFNSNEIREANESNYVISPYYFDDANADHDGDGRSSLIEQNDTQNPTNLFNPDSDGDLIPDGWELANGLDPNDAQDAGLDNDTDGATNLIEYIAASNPNLADTDGDGTNDGPEINGPDGDHNTAGGSNPNDASDGGQPLTPDERLTILLAVGDESGSHSEDYVMNIFRVNPDTGQEERFYTLRSGGHGLYKEITQDIFKKSDTYTFQIDWQSSNQGSSGVPNSPEGPDFDYTFKVEPQNDTEGLLVDSYNPLTGHPDQASSILGEKNDVTSFRNTVEKMRVLRTRVDLDVDSDNTTVTGYPAEGDRTTAEDTVEDSNDETNHPGVRTYGNYLDFDDDGIPGYADGFDTFSYSGSGACDEFEPMIVDLGLIYLFPDAEIEFVYSASDPDQLQEPATGPFIRPTGGILRIWKKNGGEARKSAPIDGGGDFIPTNTAFSVKELGTPNGTGVYKLYVEAVDELAHASSHRITMKVYPFGKTDTVERQDAVKFSIYRIASENPTFSE